MSSKFNFEERPGSIGAEIDGHDRGAGIPSNSMPKGSPLSLGVGVGSLKLGGAGPGLLRGSGAVGLGMSSTGGLFSGSAVPVSALGKGFAFNHDDAEEEGAGTASPAADGEGDASPAGAADFKMVVSRGGGMPAAAAAAAVVVAPAPAALAQPKKVAAKPARPAAAAPAAKAKPARAPVFQPSVLDDVVDAGMPPAAVGAPGGAKSGGGGGKPVAAVPAAAKPGPQKPPSQPLSTLPQAAAAPKAGGAVVVGGKQVVGYTDTYSPVDAAKTKPSAAVHAAAQKAAAAPAAAVAGPKPAPAKAAKPVPAMKAVVLKRQAATEDDRDEGDSGDEDASIRFAGKSRKKRVAAARAAAAAAAVAAAAAEAADEEEAESRVEAAADNEAATDAVMGAADDDDDDVPAVEAAAAPAPSPAPPQPMATNKKGAQPASAGAAVTMDELLRQSMVGASEGMVAALSAGGGGDSGGAGAGSQSAGGGGSGYASSSKQAPSAAAAVAPSLTDEEQRLHVGVMGLVTSLEKDAARWREELDAQRAGEAVVAADLSLRVTRALMCALYGGDGESVTAGALPAADVRGAVATATADAGRLCAALDAYDAAATGAEAALGAVAKGDAAAASHVSSLLSRLQLGGEGGALSPAALAPGDSHADFAWVLASAATSDGADGGGSLLAAVGKLARVAPCVKAGARRTAAAAAAAASAAVMVTE